MKKLNIPFSISKLGGREKLGIVVWTLVMLGFFYTRGVYQPWAERLKETYDQIEALRNEQEWLKSKQPDIEERRQTVSNLKTEISTRHGKLIEAEKELLDLQDVDKLLESFIKERGQFELVINSVRPVKEETSRADISSDPKSEKQAEPYQKLTVQLDMFATFQGLVDYIDFLEKMQPYQGVTKVKVEVEGKDVSKPHAVLLVSVLLGETLGRREQGREEVFALLDETQKREKKDPFLTRDKPKELVTAVGLSLSGVFWEGEQPIAAMINNEMYRVGQQVMGKQIVSIEAGRVLLEQGNRRFILVTAPGE
jgi:hypothetical protein